MYIRGLIPRNFAELAEVVPIGCIAKVRKHPRELDKFLGYETAERRAHGWCQ